MTNIVPSGFFLPAARSILNDFWGEWEDAIAPYRQENGISISEDDKKVYVEAQIPGIDPKDVDVTFDKGVLWIKGEAREEEEDKSKKTYTSAQRAFSYRVYVPGELDDNVEPEATYKHGVMKIAFQKAEKAQPKKIQLKAVNE